MRFHSFFIPDIEYLVDLEGFLRYIGEKVSVGNICLFCNGKGRSFHSLEAIRSHMVEKGHCKILYEEDTAEEYADYYDFSPSYPVDDESAPVGLVEGTAAGDNEEWEDVEDEDDADEEVIYFLLYQINIISLLFFFVYLRTFTLPTPTTF